MFEYSPHDSDEICTAPAPIQVGGRDGNGLQRYRDYYLLPGHVTSSDITSLELKPAYRHHAFNSCHQPMHEAGHYQ